MEGKKLLHIQFWTLFSTFSTALPEFPIAGFRPLSAHEFSSTIKAVWTFAAFYLTTQFRTEKSKPQGTRSVRRYIRRAYEHEPDSES